MARESLLRVRAKFFHPRTMGVMHWGVVVAECHEPEHTVKVRFEVDGKAHWTFPDHSEGNRCES